MMRVFFLAVIFTTSGFYSIGAFADCDPPACPADRKYCVKFPPEPGHCEKNLIEQFKANKAFSVTIDGKAFDIMPQVPAEK